MYDDEDNDLGKGTMIKTYVETRGENSGEKRQGTYS